METQALLEIIKNRISFKKTASDGWVADKYWRSENDGEMVQLFMRRYKDDLDWSYLEKKAQLPENDTFSEILELKNWRMKSRIKEYEERSPAEFLLLREQLGMGRYRKQRKRDEEKREILLETRFEKDRRKREGRFYPDRISKKKG